MLNAWTLGPRQQRRYLHSFDVWRPNEAARALDGSFAGITWSKIGVAVPAGFDATPSHDSPSGEGLQTETDMIFTLDSFNFPAEVLLLGGDVLKMTAGPLREQRIGKFWMVRGQEKPAVIHAGCNVFLCKIIIEGAPEGVI